MTAVAGRRHRARSSRRDAAPPRRPPVVGRSTASPRPAREASLEEARVVVVGGRGVGGPEGFALVGELAGLLGGVVGATRASVDAGWIAYARQIGQTGKVVKPALYLGLGVSGAMQHRVGMQSAEAIVAVNRDPDAPIAEVADLFVVGDLFEVGPALARRAPRPARRLTPGGRASTSRDDAAGSDHLDRPPRRTRGAVRHHGATDVGPHRPHPRPRAVPARRRAIDGRLAATRGPARRAARRDPASRGDPVGARVPLRADAGGAARARGRGPALRAAGPLAGQASSIVAELDRAGAGADLVEHGLDALVAAVAAASSRRRPRSSAAALNLRHSRERRDPDRGRDRRGAPGGPAPGARAAGRARCASGPADFRVDGRERRRGRPRPPACSGILGPHH